MEYNTSRPRMIIPEYGRNVQKMVDHLNEIEDPQERLKQAENLVQIIGNLNPQVRDETDAHHKLWDHLYIMSDFKLDVDSPYPAPTAESLNEKPQEVPYPETSRSYRHYGNVVKKMVKYTAEQEAGERKEALKEAVANHMKKTYLIWNKDNVDDAVILKEMNAIAGGQLKLDELSLSEKKDLVQQSHPKKKFSKKRGKKRYKGKK